MISFGAGRLDGEKGVVDSLLGRIRVQINMIDGENIVGGICAEFERIVAGYG